MAVAALGSQCRFADRALCSGPKIVPAAESGEKKIQILARILNLLCANLSLFLSKPQAVSLTFFRFLRQLATPTQLCVQFQNRVAADLTNPATAPQSSVSLAVAFPKLIVGAFLFSN